MDKEQLRKRIDELKREFYETDAYELLPRINRLTKLYDDLYGE